MSGRTDHPAANEEIATVWMAMTAPETGYFSGKPPATLGARLFAEEVRPIGRNFLLLETSRGEILATKCPCIAQIPYLSLNPTRGI